MSDIERPDTIGAHRRAETIRIGMAGWVAAQEAIAEAYEAKDWVTLGYRSWGEYVDKEFAEKRLKLTREQRTEAVEVFRLVGMSGREIAKTLGVSRNTVGPQVAQTEPLKERGESARDEEEPCLTPTVPAPSPATTKGLGETAGAAGAGTRSSLPPSGPPSTEGDSPTIPRSASGTGATSTPTGEATRTTPDDHAAESASTPEGEEPEFVRTPAGPATRKFAEALDELVPNPDPHAEWRAGFLKRLHAALAVLRSTPDVVAEKANETCLDELARCVDALGAYRNEVVRAVKARTPDNVTPIRRVS